jgi:hypothetical protein
LARVGRRHLAQEEFGHVVLQDAMAAIRQDITAVFSDVS